MGTSQNVTEVTEHGDSVYCVAITRKWAAVNFFSSCNYFFH